MSRDKMIRILMAVMLATCSPMWCRCMINAAAAAPMTEQCMDACADPCGQSWDGDPFIEISRSVASFLCCGEQCGDTTNPADGSCDCDCCGGRVSAAPNQISTIATLAFVHLPFDLVRSTAMINVQDGLPCAIAASEGQPPTPLSLTLVSQRCLLLI